jgi:hypothetical protein
MQVESVYYGEIPRGRVVVRCRDNPVVPKTCDNRKVDSYRFPGCEEEYIRELGLLAFDQYVQFGAHPGLWIPIVEPKFGV